MNNIRRSSSRRVGVALNYVLQGLRVIVSLLYTPIVLHYLGKSEYGLYQISSSIIGYLAVLNLGFSSSYLKYASKARKTGSEEEIGKTNGLFFVVFLVLSIATLVSGLVLSHFSNKVIGNKIDEVQQETAKIIMYLLSFAMAASILDNIFTAQQTETESFVYQKGIEIVHQIVNPLVCFPLLLLGYRSVMLAVVSCSISIVKLCVDYFHSRFVLKEIYVFRNLNFGELKEVSIYTSFIFLNSVIKQVNWNVDKLIITRMLGTSETAVYSIGSQVNNIYMQFANSISTVFVPSVFKMVENKDKEGVDRVFFNIGKIQYIILLYILAAFIGGGVLFIRKWAGGEYYEAYYVAIILMLASIIPTTQVMGVFIQRAYNKHQLRTIVYSILSVVNILISIPLVKIAGVCGAAMGTFIISFIVEVLWMNYFYQKTLEINVKRLWKDIIRITLVAMPSILFAVIVWRMFFNNSILEWFLCAVAFSIIYYLAVWFWGIGKTDRIVVIQYISNYLNRILKK